MKAEELEQTAQTLPDEPGAMDELPGLEPATLELVADDISAPPAADLEPVATVPPPAAAPRKRKEKPAPAPKPPKEPKPDNRKVLAVNLSLAQYQVFTEALEARKEAGRTKDAGDLIRQCLHFAFYHEDGWKLGMPPFTQKVSFLNEGK